MAQRFDIKKTLVELLEAYKGSWRVLADETGIPYSTITHFMSGVKPYTKAIPNIGIITAQLLLDTLWQWSEEDENKTS